MSSLSLESTRAIVYLGTVESTKCVNVHFSIQISDYSRRSIIRTFRGNGKKFVISRVLYIKRFYKDLLSQECMIVRL